MSIYRKAWPLSCEAGKTTHPVRRCRPCLLAAALLVAACAGDGGDTPAGVTPDLLGYDRNSIVVQDRALVLEQRMADMSAALDRQQQKLDRQAAAIARLTDSGKMRGRSIASLKKAQLTAESQRAGDRSALESEIAALRSTIADLESRLARMSRAIEEISSEATAARLTVNRQTAERMAEAGDPVAGEIKTGQSYGIHLASYRAEDSARDGWSQLQGRHDDVLAGLDFRLKPLELESLGGQYMRLVAGPYGDVESARAACARLRPRDQFCQVTVYRGRPPISGEN